MAIKRVVPAAPTIGSNTTKSPFLAACPSRKYQRCFLRELEAKYPVTQFRLPKQPRLIARPQLQKWRVADARPQRRGSRRPAPSTALSTSRAAIPESPAQSL